MRTRFPCVTHLALIAAVIACSFSSRVAAQAPKTSVSGGAPVSDAQVTRAIRRTLDSLYEAFSFNAGGTPDWAAMRVLFLPGAAFVDPVKPGTPPHAIGADEFLKNFRRWVETTPKGKAGFREKIVAARIDHFGRVAHAYVTFEGYASGKAAVEERGLDSIQLVLDGAQWKVASFTTQYEEPGLAMPARFGGRR